MSENINELDGTTEATQGFDAYLSHSKRAPIDNEVDDEVDELDVIEEVRPKTFILHHRDSDGFGAMAIAYNSLASSEREFVIKSVQYGEPFPVMEELQADSEVYILDFSYPKEVLEEVYQKVEKLVVLDHHESARKQLEGLPYVVFDMTKSGVLLAWEYFVPEYPPTPQVELLDGWDLWNKKHPNWSWEQITAFQMACKSQGENLSFWTSLMNGYMIDPAFWELGYQHYGQFMESVKEVKEAPSTEIVEINGVKFCFFTIADYGSISLMSDAIYTDPELGVDVTVCYFPRKGKFTLSFRSKDAGVCQVNLIAEKFGGGGHKQAAGCQLDLKWDDKFDIVTHVVKLIRS